MTAQQTPERPRDGGSPHRRGAGPLGRVFLAVVAVALVVPAAVGLGAGDDREQGAATSAGAETTTPPQTAADRLAERRPDDPRALGDVDAPVVMIEWGDFLCGFCARFALEVEPHLIADYVETGILRIEWRDLPFQGDDAWRAALVGRAAAEQEAFWELHERLYTLGPGVVRRSLGEEDLRTLARALELDVERFLADVDDPELLAQVRTEAEQGRALGISGTPAFLIGDRPIVGAQSRTVFSDAIEQAAADPGVTVP